MRNLKKNNTNKQTKERKPIDTESRLVVTRKERGLGVDRMSEEVIWMVIDSN